MAQFLCLKNIRTFLSTCTSVFGLKETDLFQASMLYDYTDFARVLHTLSRLSNCENAKRSRSEYQGFPISLFYSLCRSMHNGWLVLRCNTIPKKNGPFLATWSNFVRRMERNFWCSQHLLSTMIAIWYIKFITYFPQHRIEKCFPGTGILKTRI